MTTLAARSGHPTSAFAGSMATTGHYRTPAMLAVNGNGNGVFTSPTESEFSESYRDGGRDAVQEWDEVRVGDWLRSINCGQYVELFRRNNINGEHLMEVDKEMLKEMGVKRLGDRVRINEKAKAFRHAVYKRTSKRAVNRVSEECMSVAAQDVDFASQHSLATLDNNTTLTPPSSGSPRPLHSARANNSRADKRISRQFNGADLPYGAYLGTKSTSRPSSPMIDQENRSARVPRPSLMDNIRKEQQTPSYFAQPTSARHGGSARGTPLETPQTARFVGHMKSTSTDNLNSNAIGALPFDKPLIKVIYENGSSSVVNIDGFRTAEDIIRATLRKKGWNENHYRSYAFYVLDGTDPKPKFCRKLGEAELVKLCTDRVRSERGRLILRKIHMGEPEGEQLRTAARIASQHPPEPPAIEVHPTTQKLRGLSKVEQLTGEPLAAVSYPMSPASQAEHREYFDESVSSLSRNMSQASTASTRARKLRDFYGARPPTELITQDLQSYFPEVAKEDMDRTVRMSMRRSQRLSRAVSRLSTVSNFSVASSLKDAPPLPSIADHWAKEAGAKRPPGLRPFSVVHLGRGDRPESYRESIISTLVEEEESPLEPNRKSYVSFSGAESGSDTNISSLATAITDPDGNTIMQHYFDDTPSSPGNTLGGHSETGSGSLNSRLSQFIAEDGEEPDEELMEHLQKDSWDDLKYMKGEMIGQGSFGTVFLALHAVTAELMAVKQVELPSASGAHAMDAKRNQMIDALKHEISLLREMRHENIVQYLGSNSDDEHLNIFLEYVAGGSVASMLVNYGPLPEGLTSNFVRQILNGLSYLHGEGIIHRDIKGANILVDNKGTVKISDFGISKRVEASTLLNPTAPLNSRRAGPRVSLQGSVFWMAPEVVQQTAYTKKADIWSLGCLIVEMFTGSHPHPNCTQLQAIFKIGGKAGNPENARPDLPEHASEDAKVFLRRTFEIDFERRPSAEELRGFRFVGVKAAG
ncbi:hypothetical protein LTR62_007945 [Meristemomyces frigidus]|uniref:mitogen-activated protein kinase n=1 Tax=Meristemomyces frigidus TaxID=1508187 RepID=A0AAN7YMA8_9PEZI|nr:hypothetical protein LTR62_007945 [Meristemomyces frigidus]